MKPPDLTILMVKLHLTAGAAAAGVLIDALRTHDRPGHRPPEPDPPDDPETVVVDMSGATLPGDAQIREAVEADVE